MKLLTALPRSKLDYIAEILDNVFSGVTVEPLLFP